jgi:tetratricopeptide (TPR) repeat protein
MSSVEECERTCERLTGTADLLSLDDRSAIETLGEMIDAAMEEGDSAASEQAIQLANTLQNRELTPVDHALLLYFKSIAYSDIHNAVNRNHSAPGTWERSEAEDEIISIRRVVQADGFDELSRGRKCQILTNLANTLGRYGRVPESVEIYDRALDIAPSFAMARANRGVALIRYTDLLYDPGHQGVFLVYAHADLATALSQALTEEVRRNSEWWKERLEKHLSSRGVNLSDLCINLHCFPLGDTDEERAYRQWCLENRLFVNPLNDLGPYPIAATDVLTTPSMVRPVGERPIYQGGFNQLKQEFVSARLFLFQGVTSDDFHFSDRDVLLYDTLDNPAYGLAVEKIKLAYRSFYSLLDKIAYFLNDYLELGRDPDDVSFRNIWFEGKPIKRNMHPNLLETGGAPLIGLFWLCKDIVDQEYSEEYFKALQPDAREIAELRHMLEHRYVKVINDVEQPVTAFHNDDRLAHEVLREDIVAKALKLAKIVRSALIYLSLAIRVEEVRRRQGMTENMPREKLPIYDDERKT